ncbi:hypothetical protein JXB37_02140 [candidate division WOR-3 bacterium]|nr:hypothetical protein [candidate division WOR-3 bacterium]
MDSDATDRSGNAGRAEALVLVGVILAAVLCYAWLATMVSDGQYLPVSSDEVGYYSRARAFCEHGTLTSPFVLEESVSRVGQFSSHGISYNLLHGLVARAVGFHPLNAIVTNLIFLLLALALIAVQRLPLSRRLFLVAVVLLYFTLPVYLFTWMQETMQVFFAVVAGVLLLAVYRETDPRRRRRNVVLFVVAMVVAAWFRLSWMMFLFCLVPLARSWSRALLYAAGALAGVVAGMVYTSLFHASYPYGFLASLRPVLQQGDVLRAAGLLAGNFWSNLVTYFFRAAPFSTPPGVSAVTVANSQVAVAYLGTKYLLAVLVGACCWFGVRRGDRFALAAGVIGLITFLSLFLLYDAYEWRDQRSLAPVFFLAAFALAHRARFRAATTAVLLMLFAPLVSYAATGVIPARRVLARKYRASRETVTALDRLRYQITERRTTTVLLSRFFARWNDIYLLSLPFANSSGYPIRYTINLLGEEDLEVRDEEFVDYLLVPDVGVGPDGRPIVIPLLLER